MNNYSQYFNYLNNIAKTTNIPNMSDQNKINQTSQVANKSYAEPYEAFVRGNLFNALYDQYKNYRPIELNPSNEREYALLLVHVYKFCAHELNLYLDNYPNDSEAIKSRNDYLKAYKEALNQYESKYGPLSVTSNTTSVNPWAWDTTTWPWEGNY